MLKEPKKCRAGLLNKTFNNSFTNSKNKLGRVAFAKLKPCLEKDRAFCLAQKNLGKIAFEGVLKSFLFVFFFFCSSYTAFTQSDNELYTHVDIEKPDYVIGDKRIFLNALNAFDANDYGATLKWIDKAKATRMQKAQWEVQTLKMSMRSPDVKVFGDDVANIAKVLAEREEYDALQVINHYKKYYTLEAFGNSMKRLISFIQSQSPYPEADYLSGRVYQLEGEYDVAQKLYLKAYENADILDIPDQKFDILYSLSEIAFIKKDYKRYEEYLLLIVSFDPSYKNKSFVASIKRIIRSKKGDNVEKFFKMYRSSNYKLLNAYFALSEYYQNLGEQDRALSASSLGCLTGFTKIIDVVKKRSADFSYSSISSLLDEAALYPDIVEWGKENNVWKGFNDLAQYTFESGYEAFAAKFYQVLQDHSPEEYWRREAQVMLCKIEEKNGDKGIDKNVIVN